MIYLKNLNGAVREYKDHETSTVDAQLVQVDGKEYQEEKIGHLTKHLLKKLLKRNDKF